MRCPASSILCDLSILASVAILPACTSYTTLPPSTRAALDAGWRGRSVALRVSCYYGPLYDDVDKRLLAPWPFDKTSHVNDMQGAPIFPSGQVGILPAGTVFTVDELEFPDQDATFKRMLRTPRFNPWLIMRLDRAADPFAPDDQRPMVLVLPDALPTGQAVEEAINAFVGPPDEVKRWLDARTPEIRAAILEKRLLPGMTLPELFAAFGHPLSVRTVTMSGAARDLADYGWASVELASGAVVSGPGIADQNQRPAPAP